MVHLLLRPPPTTLAQGIVSHIDDHRDTVDYGKARRQWQSYGDAFRRHGWQTIEVDQDDGLPDSVFVEDGVISVQDLNDVPEKEQRQQPGLIILASPGNPAREGEPAGIERSIRTQLKGQTIAQIQRPGTLDGGDVLKVPCQGTIYVGNSARTNTEGIQQFRALVEPLGWSVRTVAVKKALHLKSMLTALPDGTIIGYEPLLEDSSIFERFIGMPEPEGVAVVHLDSRGTAQTPLLISASAPQSVEKLTSMGYTIVTEDVSEFEVSSLFGSSNACWPPYERMLTCILFCRSLRVALRAYPCGSDMCEGRSAACRLVQRWCCRMPESYSVLRQVWLDHIDILDKMDSVYARQEACLMLLRLSNTNNNIVHVTFSPDREAIDCDTQIIPTCSKLLMQPHIIGPAVLYAQSLC